jgi:small subunit ribosomal protein S6
VNQYEIAVIYDPSLEVDLEKATSRIEKIFKDNGGEIKNTDNWGKRKLAYPIKKQEHGIYVFYTIDLPPQSIQKIESVLNITEEVIRFLIVKPDLTKIAKAAAVYEEKKAKAAARGDRDTDSDDEKSKEGEGV